LENEKIYEYVEKSAISLIKMRQLWLKEKSAKLYFLLFSLHSALAVRTYFCYFPPFVFKETILRSVHTFYQSIFLYCHYVSEWILPKW